MHIFINLCQFTTTPVEVLEHFKNILNNKIGHGLSCIEFIQLITFASIINCNSLIKVRFELLAYKFCLPLLYQRIYSLGFIYIDNNNIYFFISFILSVFIIWTV